MDSDRLAYPPTDAERAANAKVIAGMTPQERLRLMFKAVELGRPLTEAEQQELKQP